MHSSLSSFERGLMIAGMALCLMMVIILMIGFAHDSMVAAYHVEVVAELVFSSLFLACFLGVAFLMIDDIVRAAIYEHELTAEDLNP